MSNTGWNQKRRQEGYERQHGACCYCQGAMSPNTADPIQAYMATLEHLTQRRFGGSKLENNTVTACHGCNNARPCGMPASQYAMLRLLLLRAWPACTMAPPHVKRTLVALIRPDAKPKAASKG